MSKLNELNNTLFDQLKRLNDPELSEDQMAIEVERTKLMNSVASTIVNNAKVSLEGAKLGLGYQAFNPLPKMFDVPKNNVDYLEQKTLQKLNVGGSNG